MSSATIGKPEVKERFEISGETQETENFKAQMLGFEEKPKLREKFFKQSSKTGKLPRISDGLSSIYFDICEQENSNVLTKTVKSVFNEDIKQENVPILSFLDENHISDMIKEVLDSYKIEGSSEELVEELTNKILSIITTLSLKEIPFSTIDEKVSPLPTKPVAEYIRGKLDPIEFVKLHYSEWIDARVLSWGDLSHIDKLLALDVRNKTGNNKKRGLNPQSVKCIFPSAVEARDMKERIFSGGNIDGILRRKWQREQKLKMSNI